MIKDGLVVAGWSNRNVWRLELDGSVTTLASYYQDTKINTLNDFVVKSDGNIYFTDASNGMHLVGQQGADLQKHLDFEGVFKLDPNDLSLTLLRDDMTFPNGLCFSPDDSLMYVNDTTGRYIRVFDVKPGGTLGNARCFADLHGSAPGHPDGIKLTDSEPALRMLIDSVGVDRVIFGTDWPADMAIDWPVSWILSLESLTQDEKEAILWKNLENLLGI